MLTCSTLTNPMELASLIVPSNSVSILPMLPLHLFGNSYRHFMISSRSMRVEILESGRNRMADVCASVFLCWREIFFFGRARLQNREKSIQGLTNMMD